MFWCKICSNLQKRLHNNFFKKNMDLVDYIGNIFLHAPILLATYCMSFSDNFSDCDGKDCICVPLILQKNNKLKLQ